MDQSEHEAWNCQHYPGTLQLCSQCQEPTGRCEDDSLYANDAGPLCPCCHNKATVAQLLQGLCQQCGIGFLLPSGRCDHCNLLSGD